MYCDGNGTQNDGADGCGPCDGTGIETGLHAAAPRVDGSAREWERLRNDAYAMHRNAADKLVAAEARIATLLEANRVAAELSEAERVASRARIGELRAALERYGEHLETCPRDHDDRQHEPCTCGLDAALAASKGAP